MKLFIEQERYKINITKPFSGLKTTTFLTLIITIADAAKGLCVSRKTLSALLNRRFSISSEMAIRLSKGFGGSAESWLIQQSQYDLWKALQNQSQSIRIKTSIWIILTACSFF